MKKVLFMVPCFSQGGVEHTLITAISNLPEDKYDISLFIRTNETKLVTELPSSVHVLTNISAHFYRRPIAIFYNLLLFIYKVFKDNKRTEKYQSKLNEYIHLKKINHTVKKVFKNKAYDVIVAYTVDDCVEIALKIPTKRRVVFYHTPYVDFKLSMMRFALPAFNSIVACGPGVYSELVLKFPEYSDKIQLISNYVNREELVEKASVEIDKKYLKQINNKCVLCTCGRIAPAKRYDLAIEAATILKKHGLKFIWFFVGGGDEQVRFEKMVKDLDLSNYVIFTGNQNNPYPFIKRCDVYIQTSGFEAQPLTIIEAIKLGRPVVSTNTLGGRTILENGKNGVLTEISGESIALGIMTILNDSEMYDKFKNVYTPEKESIERDEYISKWVNLLNC